MEPTIREVGTILWVEINPAEQVGDIIYKHPLQRDISQMAET